VSSTEPPLQPITHPPDDDFTTMRAAIETDAPWDSDMGWSPDPIRTAASYESVVAALARRQPWMQLLPETDGPEFAVNADHIIAVHGWIPTAPGEPNDIPF